MRGYISFVLALVALAILLQELGTPRAIPITRALAVETVYQTQQNTKELVLEAMRLGAEEGLHAYAMQFGQWDVATAEEYVRWGVYRRLQEIEIRNDDQIGQSILCGERDEIVQHRCPHCRLLHECVEWIQVDAEKTSTGIRATVWLERKTTWNEHGVVGIWINQTRWGIGSASYIPPEETRTVAWYAGTD